jgi:hypothetical protein
MDNNESYIIKDLEKFIESVRTLVFNNFGKGEDETSLEVMISNLKPKEKEELDEILSQEESISIVKSLLYSSKNLYTLDDKSLTRIIESLNDRMVSNILNSLVNRGLVETAFDTESNDFVFWVKENENNKETPETD